MIALNEPVCGELLIFDTNQQFATHRPFLLGPEQRKIDAFRQSLGGEIQVKWSHFLTTRSPTRHPG